ncbi:hypothetical protein ABZ490_47160 [Streptomyces sp. NPDC005811]
MKSTQPKDKLVENLSWVTDFSPGTVRFTGVATVLTPLAAVGLGTTKLPA